MRRSKANPAKYARNYRKISQRHMTGHGGAGGKGGGSGEDDERKRLESILRESERKWKGGLEESGRAQKGNEGDDDGANETDGDPRQEEEDGMLSLLSPELRAQFSGMGGDNLLILPSKKKKQKPKREAAPLTLTPAEIKAAKAQYKNAQRKVAQLEQRRRRKELRTGLYRELEENAFAAAAQTPAGDGDGAAGNDNDSQPKNTSAEATIHNKEARSLLLKSSELGKKVTKRERLKQLRRKEMLGIKLTEEEKDVLYIKYDAPDGEPAEGAGECESGAGAVDAEKADAEDGEGSSKKRKKKKKKRRKEKSNCQDEANAPSDGGGAKQDEEMGREPKKARVEQSSTGGTEPHGTDASEGAPAASPEKQSAESTGSSTTDAGKAEPKQSFAAMMMAGLTSLKSKTDSQNTRTEEENAQKRRVEEEEAARLEEEERKKRKAYVPSETVTVSTLRSALRDDEAGKKQSSAGGGLEKKRSAVQEVNRPPEVERSRYDLPVSAMEYEIVDAVRSRDCTVLCGETGSGKSTQVPQFLYEAGFGTRGWWKGKDVGGSEDVGGGDDGGGDDANGEGDRLLIGITQPRRVAAVSTAKRVSYEMGCSDGRTVPRDNLVAYQTRYESAGLGRSTRVKFMTDGILLQEIQSDLLLRRYGAVVIDEAHERNLNTDVLLGLLSRALPLRRRAAEEGGLPPLKLVVMSATLRVEDFTENGRLFPEEGGTRPALVRVPGRTFPVSVHHSKVTELDDYEKAAMEKTCKIHRKLPPGGILVFLTGKQEIVQCVKRLKQRLEPRSGKKRAANQRIDEHSSDANDVQQPIENDAAANGGLRDMDDDEADGDLFQRVPEEDDFDDLDRYEDVDAISAGGDDGDDRRPRKVRILPLYSMLSADEQAKVFAPVPEDTRLIVVATNIAETSITIPEISYVVDSGRQKCRNYHAGTGVASYDVMWISKAAADQRAGRAGRTGPGHCYRLYSSSVYSRHLDDFALPEVLTRPLEDVVLAMKAMRVSNVASFPFPTPPEHSQVDAAVRLLANLGCVDVSRVEEHGGDGRITPLGAAVAKLPLGVRYGKMLLVAAQAGVLDYAIAMVAVLSESTPFAYRGEVIDKGDDASVSKELEGLDEVEQKEHRREIKSRWMHDGGDVLAAVKAVGAYAYAGRGAGGMSEKLACRQFCEENELHPVAMQRIAKMRLHLCKLAKARLPNAGGVAAETGKYLPSMPPPKRAQECLLRQAIVSGLLDNVARRAPPGILPTEYTGVPRSAYICGGNSRLKDPLFIDNNSTVHSKRPEWVCFDSIVRKTKRDGTTVAVMQRVTPIDPEWLASLCHGSNLMALGSPLANPLPRYVRESDSLQCAVETKFGGHGWEIPPCYVNMYNTIHNENSSNGRKQTSALMKGDSFRWFARYLLEGRVLPELSGLMPMLNDEPAIVTRRKPVKKVTLLVSALSEAGVDSAAALRKHWADRDDKFLFRALRPWVDKGRAEDAKQLWRAAVTTNVNAWRARERER